MPLACRSLHVANTAQVLEVDEVQGRRGVRIAGGADDRLRRQMHQIGDTLQVDGKRATLQDATRERPRRSEVPITDEARRGWEHIDLGEDRVIGETVGDGLRVREVDRHGLRRLRRRRGTSKTSCQASTAAELRHQRHHLEPKGEDKRGQKISLLVRVLHTQTRV